jgi:hypothetical protein
MRAGMNYSGRPEGRPYDDVADKFPAGAAFMPPALIIADTMARPARGGPADAIGSGYRWCWPALWTCGAELLTERATISAAIGVPSERQLAAGDQR